MAKILPYLVQVQAEVVVQVQVKVEVDVEVQMEHLASLLVERLPTITGTMSNLPLADSITCGRYITYNRTERDVTVSFAPFIIQYLKSVYTLAAWPPWRCIILDDMLYRVFLNLSQA